MRVPNAGPCGGGLRPDGARPGRQGFSGGNAAGRSEKRIIVMAITVFPRTARQDVHFVASDGACARRETVMIKIRSGMFGAVGLLLGVVPTATFAENLRGTAEQRAACMGDAIMLCSSAIPNRERIAACLASKMSRLTPQCRAQFAKN